MPSSEKKATEKIIIEDLFQNAPKHSCTERHRSTIFMRNFKIGSTSS